MVTDAPNGHGVSVRVASDGIIFSIKFGVHRNVRGLPRVANKFLFQLEVLIIGLLLLGAGPVKWLFAVFSVQVPLNGLSAANSAVGRIEQTASKRKKRIVSPPDGLGVFAAIAAARFYTKERGELQFLCKTHSGR